MPDEELQSDSERGAGLYGMWGLGGDDIGGAGAKPGGGGRGP